MNRHTTVGGAILQGSSSPVIRMARQIALTITSAGTAAATRADWPARRSRCPAASARSATCLFDALLSERPYKRPWPLEDALAELRRGRGHQFDPAVVDAFLGRIDEVDGKLLAAGAAPGDGVAVSR
jgi:putative two-component system response regulator